MTASLWEVFGIFAYVFTGPITQAATPVPLELPQDIQYNEYVASQISNGSFSNDPQHLLGVLRERAALGETEPLLEAFLYNGSACTTTGDTQTYRILVRNVGGVVANNVSVQVQYPEEMRLDDATPDPEHDLETSLLTWFGQPLAPGGLLTYSYTLTTAEAANFYLNNLTVYYLNDEQVPFVTIGERRLSGTCGIGDSLRSFLSGRSPVRPAIVCDPAEIGCSETYQSLDLGRNYFETLDPQRRPVVCSDHDRNLRQGLVPSCQDVTPQLGIRFAEAVADIIPGECRVVEDNRITEVAFNDSLNRRSRPAAPYLVPLFTSSQDFRQLVHENVLLGIDHNSVVTNALQPIHHDTWERVLAIAYDRLNRQTSSGSAQGQLIAARDTAINRVINTQPSLQDNYDTVQDRRRENFPRLIPTAATVQRAEASIIAACEGPRGDGGLSGRLPQVESLYNAQLSNRQGDYTNTQTQGLAAYTEALDEWIDRLRAGFNELDRNDNPLLLEQVIQEVEGDREDALVRFLRPYRDHLDTDEDLDTDVRVDSFEPALNGPKSVATDCEKEQERGRGFCRPEEVGVELVNVPGECNPGGVLYCENQTPPAEGIAPTILRPGVRVGDARPPQHIPQAFVQIDPRLTFGSACSGRPGDPWWSADCSCDCGSVIPIREGSVQFCEPGTGFYTEGGQRVNPYAYVPASQEALALRRLLAPFRPLLTVEASAGDVRHERMARR